MEFQGTGRTVTLQMLLAAKILEPGKSKMTIEYLVIIYFCYEINNMIELLMNRPILDVPMIFVFRDKNLLETCCRMVKLNHRKLRPFSVRQVHGPCIASVLSIRRRNRAAAGHRLNTMGRNWMHTKLIICESVNCRRSRHPVKMVRLLFLPYRSELGNNIQVLFVAGDLDLDQKLEMSPPSPVKRNIMPFNTVNNRAVSQ